MRGPISRRPDDSDAGGRGQVEGGRKVATGEFKRFFPHSTSRFPQQKREALLADRVREVGGWPEFSVRYGGAVKIFLCNVSNPESVSMCLHMRTSIFL